MNLRGVIFLAGLMILALVDRAHGAGLCPPIEFNYLPSQVVNDGSFTNDDQATLTKFYDTACAKGLRIDITGTQRQKDKIVVNINEVFNNEGLNADAHAKSDAPFINISYVKNKDQTKRQMWFIGAFLHELGHIYFFDSINKMSLSTYEDLIRFFNYPPWDLVGWGMKVRKGQLPYSKGNIHYTKLQEKLSAYDTETNRLSRLEDDCDNSNPIQIAQRHHKSDDCKTDISSNKATIKKLANSFCQDFNRIFKSKLTPELMEKSNLLQEATNELMADAFAIAVTKNRQVMSRIEHTDSFPHDTAALSDFGDRNYSKQWNANISMYTIDPDYLDDEHEIFKSIMSDVGDDLENHNFALNRIPQLTQEMFSLIYTNLNNAIFNGDESDPVDHIQSQFADYLESN